MDWRCQRLRSAITGWESLTFVTRHLFQLHFADFEECFFGSPQTLIDWWPCWLIIWMYLWTSEENVPVFVRGIFPTESVARLLHHGGYHVHGFRLPRVGEARAGKLVRWLVCGVFHNVPPVLSRGTARKLFELVMACRVRLDGDGKAKP